MKIWRKTGCVLCAQNCGLEILVEDQKMVQVRPDRDNPRSRGYACRKGMKILQYQYPGDRLTVPLKRVGGAFEPLSWEQATSEIAARLQHAVTTHGPKCLAYMGASSQGGHFEATFGLALLRALGSQYLYSSAGQEFSGAWWVFGRMLGRQYNITVPDEGAAEMLIAWGWNGMQSHQMPRAPKVLTAIARDPDRLLVVIDPRTSETARIANLHLPVAPGTDALLMKAMIAIILERGWENAHYLESQVHGFEKIRPWFLGMDIAGALTVCGLEYQQVVALCRMLATKRWCVHPDLGIYMGRHSTLNSYLLNILGILCGRIGVRGGNVIPGMVMPLGFHADERNPKTWRTVATGMPPAAAGSFPPAVVPEEILQDHPQRLRAIYVNGCNPLRSYPDTTAYEKAFARLDLLVVCDIAMTETARLAHYVLPCRTPYESWDGTFFPWTYPEVYFQMRQPLVPPPGNCLEASQIFTALADKLGIIPDIPAEVLQASRSNRMEFGAKLLAWAAQEPDISSRMAFILARTLGETWQSANKAALWGMLMTAPKSFRENAARAGFAPGRDQGERIFQAILESPQGLWVGRADTVNPLAGLATPSGKIEVYIPELEEQAQSLSAANEKNELKLPDVFPLILHAGRHMRYNANTLMRDPSWNTGKRACTVAMHPDDVHALGLDDGQRVRVTTAAGSETGELEMSRDVRRGTVLIPHGFGLSCADGGIYGLNVNRLTKGSHRDPLGTPLHRFVPCRVEPAP